MAITVTHADRDHARDGGFTLLEVVVAMLLVGVVATAALGFTVSGVSRSASIQQRQSAVEVANQAMEQVRALSAAAMSGTPVTGLVKGRTSAAVAAQWAASSNPDRAITWQSSDSAATSSSPVVPLTQTVALGGRSFTVSTLIGTCYRVRASTTGPCLRQGTAEPASDPTYVPLARVMVEVSWTPVAAGTCASAACVYRATALVDPSDDLTWNPTTGLGS